MSTEPASIPDMPPIEATFTAADGTRTTVRITSPAKLLNVVPHLLGFHPDECVVIIGTKGPRGTVHVTQRVPLDCPNDPALITFAAKRTVSVLVAAACSNAFVVGYGPEDRVTPFVRQFRGLAVEHGVTVPEILRVADNRYWSYVCTDSTGCQPEGTPYAVAPSPELVRLLPEGASGVLQSRDDLAAMVAPVTGTVATSMRRATVLGLVISDKVSQFMRYAGWHPGPAARHSYTAPAPG
jgi:hypothetical protein